MPTLKESWMMFGRDYIEIEHSSSHDLARKLLSFPDCPVMENEGSQYITGLLFTKLKINNEERLEDVILYFKSDRQGEEQIEG